MSVLPGVGVLVVRLRKDKQGNKIDPLTYNTHNPCGLLRGLSSSVFKDILPVFNNSQPKFMEALIEVLIDLKENPANFRETLKRFALRSPDPKKAAEIIARKHPQHKEVADQILQILQAQKDKSEIAATK